MKFKAALAIAAITSVMVMPMTAVAQGKSKAKSNNGLHKGWAKQAAKNKGKSKVQETVVRVIDSRYQSQNRYDNRNDSRYSTGNRYDYNSGDRYNTYPYNTNQREADRRQQTKNEWRNIAYAAGALTVLGLLQKDNTLTFAGAAGALYSLHRYEQDRKSQNSYDRARSRYFDYDHFYRDGVRYDRRVVTQNGQRYYQFVRAR